MEDAYFRDENLVRKAFNYADNPLDEEGRFHPWFNNSDSHRRFIHVDLGLKRDRSALCMTHCSGITEIKTSMGVEKLPVINVDLIYSWQAEPGEEINFASVRQMIIDLCRRFDVGLVTFDRWQSVEMIQSLRALGVNADFHSVKKTDYDTLMTAIYDTRLRGYWDDHLVEDELLKLRLFSNNRIDHPNSGSKDMADALAGSVFAAASNIMVDNEIDLEILNFDIDSEKYDDLEDFGTVSLYDGNTGKFSPTYSTKKQSGENFDFTLENL